MDIHALMLACRWLQYLCLMLVFGLPAFSLWLRPADPPPLDGGRGWATVLLLSLLSSLTGFWVLTGSMAGTLAPSVVYPLAIRLLTATAVGTALTARLAMLAACLGLLLWPGPSSAARLWLRTLLAAVALATPAWAGHAAMDEGWRGVLHLGVDILHLLSGGLWLGALCLLCGQAVAAVQGGDPRARARLYAAASRFAPLGSGMVLALSASGLVNAWLMLGTDAARLWQTGYGHLLLWKLGLFTVMLGLAADHRFRQVPRLAQAGAAPRPRRLLASLGLEMALALLVLAVVAQLGIMDPSAPPGQAP